MNDSQRSQQPINFIFHIIAVCVLITGLCTTEARAESSLKNHKITSNDPEHSLPHDFAMLEAGTTWHIVNYQGYTLNTTDSMSKNSLRGMNTLNAIDITCNLGLQREITSYFNLSLNIELGSRYFSSPISLVTATEHPNIDKPEEKRAFFALFGARVHGYFLPLRWQKHALSLGTSIGATVYFNDKYRSLLRADNAYAIGVLSQFSEQILLHINIAIHLRLWDDFVHNLSLEDNIIDALSLDLSFLF